MHPFQLMSKPTGSICNLDCSYCFYLEKPHSNQIRMSDEVLEHYVRDYLQHSPQQHVTFLWQGGEPTLAGLEFYQQAVINQSGFVFASQAIGVNEKINQPAEFNGFEKISNIEKLQSEFELKQY